MNERKMDTAALVQEVIHEIVSSPNWNEVLDIINDCKHGNPLGKNGDDRAKYVVKLLNMHYLGNGSQRIVMTSLKNELTSVVVKMPLDFTGFEDNDEEAYIWQQANDAVRYDIVPLYAWEEEFIINRRIEAFTTAEEGILFKDEIYTTYKRLRANGLIPIDLHPERYEQWGLMDGRVVALDTARCILQDRAKRNLMVNVQ